MSLLFHSRLMLSLIFELGINVLIHANAVDASMGSGLGSDWQETSACLLACWRNDRDGYLWAE
jgi:hypothetical protein